MHDDMEGDDLLELHTGLAFWCQVYLKALEHNVSTPVVETGCSDADSVLKKMQKYVDNRPAELADLALVKFREKKEALALEIGKKHQQPKRAKPATSDTRKK